MKFTCKAMNNSLDFSFSGIKTAVLYLVKGDPSTKSRIPDIAASFQEAVLSVIVENSVKAIERYKVKSFVTGGGVSANSRFREMMQRESRYKGFKLYFPPLNLCSDNAAMTAGLAYRLYKKGIRSSLEIAARV